MIPAAGASARLGRPKQLVPIEGEALVRRSARLAVETGAARVLVVTGACADDVAAALEGLPVELVHNAAYSSGLGGSIAAGARAAGHDMSGLMVLLCDQWRIGADDLRRLLAAWWAEPERIVAARWPGGQGPPVIFPAAHLAALCSLQGDAGAKRLLSAVPGGCRFVDLARAAFDLDTPADLALVGRPQAG